MNRPAMSEIDQAIRALNCGIRFPRRRAKFGNQPVHLDGHRFDSQLEARRYGQLKLLVQAKAISDLKVHESIFLHVNGRRIGRYEADFQYFENGQIVLEDCKGVRTALYLWKKRHVKAEYGLDIREIKQRR